MSRRIVIGIGEVLWDVLPEGPQLGGAPANFAYHAAALGADAAVVSRVGDDALGREILQRLDALRVDRRFVGLDCAHPTGTVDVRLDAAGVPQYVIHEPVAWDHLVVDRASLELISRADVVCFGTLASRSEVSRKAIASALDAAGGRRCLRVFDINLRQRYYSRQIVDDLLHRCDVLKLNDAELPVVAEMFGIGGAGTRDAARWLIDHYGVGLVALTRGAHGSMLFGRDGGTSEHPGSSAGPVADTVGAGDAFTAALVTGLLAGAGLDRINDVANRLAAYVCTQRGATPTVPDEFRESLGGA